MIKQTNKLNKLGIKEELPQLVKEYLQITYRLALYLLVRNSKLSHFKIRNNSIKTRYHYIPIRMAKIWNTEDTRFWQGCGKIGTLIHCWWKCKIVQKVWKTVWWFLRKPNMFYHITQQLFSLVFTQMNRNFTFTQKSAHRCFYQLYSEMSHPESIHDIFQ